MDEPGLEQWRHGTMIRAKPLRDRLLSALVHGISGWNILDLEAWTNETRA